jgi:SAM-dependent methyltransferase
MTISLHRLHALAADASPLGAVVEHLRAAHYTADSVARLVGAESPGELFALPALYAMAAAEGALEPGALATLARLFWFAHAIDGAEWSALPPAVTGALDGARLVRSDGARLRGEVSVCELGGALFFCDRAFEHRDGAIDLGGAPPDAAMAIHESTVRLARALAPGGERLLDVGAGAGALSILARRRETHGIDTSERCVAFARLNAAINRAPATCERADCFTFETARRFDRVVFNTPWLLDEDPAARWRRFVTERLDRLLAPDGVAQLFALLPLTRDAPTVEAALGGFAGWRLHALVDRGGLAIAPDELARGTLRRGCLHLRAPGDGPRLARALVERGVVEVAPLVLTATRGAGAEVSVDERPL